MVGSENQERIVLSDVAKMIFKDLYCFSGETIDECFRRVAKEYAKTDEDFENVYNLMKNNVLRGNTPVFFNAGTKHKIFSACYVVGIEDSMNSIYDVANVARKIFQHGSGIGIPIGNLREKDANIFEGNKNDSPMGKSSGPISFMQLFDAVGATTKSGGRARRAAIMCVMPVWHPDIMDFIGCKEVDGKFSNMNISVAITDKFMRSFKDNIPYELKSPSDGETVREMNARQIWDNIIDMAWKTGDPGIIFIDTMNKYNTLQKIMIIQATNPSLRAGTKILTENGIFPIEQLENKRFNIINQNSEYSPAECFLSGKDKELYEMTLEGNKKYYATAEHKWPVFVNGKYEKTETSNLKIGDNLPIAKITSLNYGHIGSYEDGFVVGWNLGDGWITDRTDNSKRQYGFIFSDDDINNGTYFKIENYLSTISGNRYNNITTRNGCIEINTSCKKIDENFKLFGVGKKSDGLPNKIWTELSEDFRKGLIDALFSSDGYVDLKGDRVIFVTSHEKLANDVFDLLGFYGIKTRLSTSSSTSKFPNGKDYNKTYTRYNVSFSGTSVFHFREIFNLSNKRKNELLWKLPKSKERLDQSHVRIKNIIKTDLKENVWDIRVYDDTHTFKISHAITGNCGEQPLGPYLACNISSINVHKFCKDGEFDFDGLYSQSYDVMNYMDNLIDVMEFPDERFKVNVMKYRPIGIGLMGLSDAMFELDIPYDSQEGKVFAGQIMKTINTACIEASADRARELGTFEKYDLVKDDVIRILAEHTDNNEYVMDKVRKYGVRNSQFTTAAPTGTTALSCDCSYGIEPSFGLIFQKTLIETGETVTIVNPIFKRRFENEAWYTPDLVEKIVANKGSLKGIRGIPKEVRDVFVVAHDIKYKDRIDVQAELQKYCSTGISSTLNLPSTATRDEVSELYRYAYQKGLKGVTIYRDGSKKSQPISFTRDKTQVQSNFVRPNVLKANVHTLETGNGKLYITVSTHNGRPVEIFMSMGKSGQFLNNFSEALGRAISIALQHGVPVESISKTLMGINSDRPIWARFEDNDKKPTQILSIPDGIAKLLQRYYTDDIVEEDIDGERELCTKCGTYSVIFMEGCKICQNCGLSACS